MLYSSTINSNLIWKELKGKKFFLISFFTFNRKSVRSENGSLLQFCFDKTAYNSLKVPLNQIKPTETNLKITDFKSQNSYSTCQASDDALLKLRRQLNSRSQCKQTNPITASFLAFFSFLPAKVFKSFEILT